MAESACLTKSCLMLSLEKTPLFFSFHLHAASRIPYARSPLIQDSTIMRKSQMTGLRRFRSGIDPTLPRWKNIINGLYKVVAKYLKMQKVRLNGIQLSITQLLPNRFQCNLQHRVREYVIVE